VKYVDYLSLTNNMIKKPADTFAEFLSELNPAQPQFFEE
jgi:hypothetical protein